MRHSSESCPSFLGGTHILWTNNGSGLLAEKGLKRKTEMKNTYYSDPCVHLATTFFHGIVLFSWFLQIHRHVQFYVVGHFNLFLHGSTFLGALTKTFPGRGQVPHLLLVLLDHHLYSTWSFLFESVWLMSRCINFEMVSQID